MSREAAVYTDGSFNPITKSMTAGVRIIFLPDATAKEVSVPIRDMFHDPSSCKAELLAISVALNQFPVQERREFALWILTDSQYSIDVLKGNCKVRANRQIIDRVKQQLLEFRSAEFVKVKGHSSHVGNRRVDQLANEAHAKRRMA